MKGLLIKDICVLLKQMKVFLALMLVFAVVQQTYTQGFGLMYFSSLTVTAIAYDEQVRWDTYAAMMPYRTKDLVLSKYVLGIAGCFAIFILEIAAAAVYGSVKGEPVELLVEKVQMIVIFFCIALILMSVNLPLVFRLGAEKGRYVWIFVTMGVALAVVASVEKLPELWSLNPSVYPAAAAAAAIVLLILSIGISMKAYRAKYC